MCADNSYPDEFQLWKPRSDSRFAFLQSETHISQSANTLHTLRFGYSRVRNTEDADPPDVPAELSFVEGQPIGMIQVTGLTTVTSRTVFALPRIHLLQDFQWNYDLSYMMGRHSLRFGSGYDHVSFRQRGDFAAPGRYQFTSIKNLLLAQTWSGDLMTPDSDTSRLWRQHQYYFYLQDEVRVLRNLHLTLGVRYEGYTTPGEADGKIATLPDPLHDTEMTLGGPLFDNPSAKNFAPRVALAWDVSSTGRTVIRAGVGMFFDLLTSREVTIAGMRVSPFYNRVFIKQPAFPDLLSASEEVKPGITLDGTAYNVQQPYVLQYRFSIEQQLGPNTAAELGYAGSRGAHLYGQLGDINIVQPELLADGRLFFEQGAPLRNPAIGRTGMRTTDFNSFYHSLLIRLQHRFAHGLQIQSSYTWSKLIDESSSITQIDFDNSDLMPHPLNIRMQRGLSDFDIRHAFNTNIAWAFPGPDRGWARHLLGAWEIHGIIQAQTGFPFNPRTGFDRTRLQSGFSHLDQRPSLSPTAPDNIILGDPQKYFDPAAFLLPEAGFYGDLGRNTLAGPGLFTMHLGFHKSIWRTERHDVRFRAEAFNITNHPNFDIPSSLRLFSSSGGRVGSAGRITSTSTPARQMQLALRWAF